jgi:ABC-type amino acid transport substrate-binding protein
METGTANVGVAALTITAEREAVLDFTHPFYSSGLGIATTLGATRPRWLLVLQGLFSWTFLQAVLALVGVLLVAAVGVWLFERKHNADQFGGPGLRGLGHSFWWSAVTMTTVGYGDKSPQTIGGRLVALIWMFTSVIVISSFTATIASSLTLSQFHSLIRGPDDLRRVRVGTVPGTTSDEYLRSQGINPILAESLPAALDQLAAGQVAAVVYDAPLLLYRVNQQFAGRLQVLPQTFARQNYAFALPTGSPLREPINKALLKKLSEPQWEEIRLRYLGR